MNRERKTLRQIFYDTFGTYDVLSVDYKDDEDCLWADLEERAFSDRYRRGIKTPEQIEEKRLQLLEELRNNKL